MEDLSCAAWHRMNLRARGRCVRQCRKTLNRGAFIPCREKTDWVHRYFPWAGTSVREIRIGDRTMHENMNAAVCAAFEPELLLEQLRLLGTVGKESTAGRTRLALTDADREGRDTVVGWMRELGLAVHVDRIGNLFGVLDGSSSEEAPLMMGSHIDTVRMAGHLDGAYGVLAALAVLRAFRKAGVTPPRSLVAGAFTNEEGVRFQPDMLGSLVTAGGFPLDLALNRLAMDDGARLGDELKRIGYAGEMEPGALRPREYFELHVEQGPVLEDEGRQIGIVEGVQGISWTRVVLSGAANHAGTTPTRLRRDAGYAAGLIITGVRSIAEALETTVGTVGSIGFEPGLINVIPSGAELTVDLRDPDEGRLLEAERRLDELLHEVSIRAHVDVRSERLVHFAPVPFSQELVAMIERLAEERGLSHRRMISGAGHDAQMMARIAGVAMIFVPSAGGVSHSPDERTSDEDLIAGARLLLDAVLQRL